MPGTPLLLDYVIRTVSPLRLPALSGALAAAGPTLPGSTLKGAVRRSAVAMTALLQLPVCRADADSQCPICRIFGAPGGAACVLWADATLLEESPAPGRADALETRRRRAVDRSLGLSSGDPAGTSVALPVGLTFQARLHGLLADDGQADMAVLTAALLRTEWMAGGLSSGFGRVAVTVNALHLSGVRQDLEELLGALLAGEAV